MGDMSGQIMSQTSPECMATGPSSIVASPGMVPRPPELKPCREGYCICLVLIPLPLKSEGPKMGFQRPSSPNYMWFASVCMLQQAGTLQQVGTLQWGLEFAAGVENSLGEARYPC